MPEIDPHIASTTAPEVLRHRRGYDIRMTGTHVHATESQRPSTCRTETIEAETIVLAAGITPDPVGCDRYWP